MSASIFTKGGGFLLQVFGIVMGCIVRVFASIGLLGLLVFHIVLILIMIVLIFAWKLLRCIFRILGYIFKGSVITGNEELENPFLDVFDYIVEPLNGEIKIKIE